MDNWKVTLEDNGITIEIIIRAKSYADAYLSSQVTNPDCKVISIKLQQEGPEDKNDKTQK